MTNAADTLPILDPLIAADPVEFFQRAASEHRVARLTGLGSYLINGYADIIAALKNPGLIGATVTRGLNLLSPPHKQELARARQSIDLWLGGDKPADHRRIVRLLKHHFTPATVEGLRLRVAQLTHQLLDEVAHRGRMEVVADLAFPLPANIIAEIFGMPNADYGLLRAWSRGIGGFFQGVDMDRMLAGQDSIVEMEDYLRGIADARRRHPGQDLITVLVQAEREGLVTEDEIVANCIALLFAGHETTRLAIATGLKLLMDRPDQLAMLKSNPKFIGSAVEEILRFGGPTMGAFRQSTEPVSVAGYEFAAGEHFFLSVVAANRDPAMFVNPNDFDITRTDNRHLTFGVGQHHCLGAALARVELNECLRVVLERLPNLRPAADSAPVITYLPPLIRRLDTLPVDF